MSTRDAANLLIAVNGSALAKNVGRDVPLLRSMRLETTRFALGTQASSTSRINRSETASG